MLSFADSLRESVRQTPGARPLHDESAQLPDALYDEMEAEILAQLFDKVDSCDEVPEGTAEGFDAQLRGLLPLTDIQDYMAEDGERASSNQHVRKRLRTLPC